MGSGFWSDETYACYSTSCGKSYSSSTGRVSGQEFTSIKLDESLDPKKFSVRECVDSDEHPNTVPVILALDVTGSMGESCKECAEALGVIMTNLYKKYKDIEFCVMGIGDLAYDRGPVQMSQFESDIRIAEALDKIWMEMGGGGNTYESYTAAWYMALKRTRLDAITKRSRKGIIITMGDEELNPYLPKDQLNRLTGSHEQNDVETKELYGETEKNFDIYHIAVNSRNNCFSRHEDGIQNTWGQLLGSRLKISTVNELATTIENCIDESFGNTENGEVTGCMVNENGEITW